MYDVGVLVVTYNQVGMTRQWLDNYLRLFNERESIYLLLLDNDSSDDTYNVLKKEYPSVDIRKLNDNYGCTKGRNIGICILDSLQCTYYASFDVDVFPNEPDYFNRFIKEMNENPHISGYCPVLRWYKDGSIQGLGGRRKWHGAMKTVMEIGINRRVDYIPGGANFIRIDAFKKYGLYDNDLPPIGGQDYEWGYRASKLGAIFEYLPTLNVVHRHDKNEIFSQFKLKQEIMGRIIFLRKHFNVGNLTREARFFFSAIKPYGTDFVLSAYREALSKHLTKENYNFELFKAIPTTSYYSSDFKFTGGESGC